MQLLNVQQEMHLVENNLSNVKNNNQTLITLHAKEKEKYDIQIMEVKNTYEEHTLDTKNNYSNLRCSKNF